MYIVIIRHVPEFVIFHDKLKVIPVCIDGARAPRKLRRYLHNTADNFKVPTYTCCIKKNRF